MIKGNLVNIRTAQEADLPALYAHLQDYSQASDYMPVTLTSQPAFFKMFRDNGFWQDISGRLIIENREQQLVGEIGCFHTAHYIDGREVYYRIFAEHRNKGYAKNTLALFIRFFFESTHFNRLQALTVEGNDVSSGMLKKQNFTYEGRLRQARWFKGRLVDLELFSVLRSERSDKACSTKYSKAISAEMSVFPLSDDKEAT